MSQPNWHPPGIKGYGYNPTRRSQAFSPKQKIITWLAALLSTWLMGLGLVKLSVMLYGVLKQLV